MFLGIFKYFLVATPLENMCKYPRTHLKLFATDFLLGKQKFHGDNKRCQPRLTFLCNKILLGQAILRVLLEFGYYWRASLIGRFTVSADLFKANNST